jgi:hypothetical protein
VWQKLSLSLTEISKKSIYTPNLRLSMARGRMDDGLKSISATFFELAAMDRNVFHRNV